MGSSVKALLDKELVLVVHVEGEKAEEWKSPEDSYVPQTYFYAQREETPLPIHGTSEGSPHFFHDESTLAWGIEKMLQVVASGERYNSDGQQRTDL